MNSRTFTPRRIAAGILALAALAAFSHSPAQAGSGQPGCYRPRTLSAGYQQTFTETFRAGEIATARAEGDGDIDMYVYDENGRLIDQDTASDGEPVCRWTPRWTGQFTIKIVNADRYSVDYRLCTN